MLEQARRKHPGVEVEQIGLQELAFRDAFDAAICIDAMEYVPPEDWPVVLGNLRRAARPGGLVYLTVEERSYRKLYRYVPKTKSFKRIDVGCEVIEQGDIARKRPAAVYAGSGATTPRRLYSVDLLHGRSHMIYDPSADVFTNVMQGTVESWNFTASSGTTIEGYFYLPPGFDPQKKYPCIVYYYGGTSPTTRNFGGSYPKNLWADEGYVVYVLQPSGATGFGQAFSALHVNDWGKIVSDEIIEGVKKFVEAHPFVDGTKLGCIGASYGGFMTELLVTKTDLFAAAVSHAGISSISSYWGAGYWGYAYNAVAAAGSFPWNRKDIYVEQSPLFSADKVKTPILLLHGTADTNVPTNESEQFFTALKLLGKTVEYVRVEGENHGIMDYNKRKLWMKTTLAWFDRWLKGEPDWWNDLYPPAEGAEGAAQEGAAPHVQAPGSPPPSIGFKIVDKKDGSKVLVGEVTRDDIVKNVGGWDAEYFTYQPNDTVIGELAGRLDGVTLLVVLGTWCSDSHREVPRLWKILETVGFPRESVRLLAVERAKATADSTLSQELLDWSKNVRDYYAIKAVESIIVYRGGVELGRIVEAPAKSIEADLLAILKK
jgi:predicted peptidase